MDKPCDQWVSLHTVKIRTHIVHLALLAGTAFSVSAAVQFDASFAPSLTARDGAVAAWSSTAGSAILAPCHGASNGWAAATLTAEGLCFGETAAGVPSPFAFYPAWLATIPLPPHSLVVSEQDISLGSGGTGTWSTPNEIASTFMHHDAFYDIRTFSPGQSGNQATYDNLGTMIISTIAAGSADRYAPYSSGGYVRPNFNHRNNDVYPYILSLQLDGNPVKAGNDTFPTSLDRPCLYQGPNVEKYQQCRPAVY